MAWWNKLFRMSPPLLVTEDTPPDMLTGHMDLRLVLPNGNRVKMSIDRRTPMMDLLVQVTTAYKMSPAGYVLQPYGESGLLPYKPSTPIGALDTWTVHIVPKTQSLQNPANKIALKQVSQPFEQTFRFQVNLPRNQLYVTRVSGRTTIAEVLRQVCSEKELDSSKYTLKHPKHLDGPSLCDDLSVAEYGHNQVSMVSTKSIPSTISTEDILAMKSYITKSSESSSRSLSPDSSVSPRQPVQPSRPLRKRRPAPKPPVQQQNNRDKNTLNTKQQSEGAQVICHSRTSSDSSGYHEASVLSESADNNSSLPDSLPRRSKLPTEKPTNKLSRSLSNLHHASTSQPGMKAAQSIPSLAPSRKKKPAPPPPVVAIAEEKEEPTIPRTTHTLPAGARLTSPAPAPRTENVVASISAGPPVAIQEQVAPQNVGRAVEEDRKTNSMTSLSDLETERIEEEIERMFDQATREHVSLESGVDVGESSPELGPENITTPELSVPDHPQVNESVNSENKDESEEDPFDWEYKLPAPPTFRDETSSPTVTEYSTMTVGQIKDVLYDKQTLVEEPPVIADTRITSPPPLVPPPPVQILAVIPKEETVKKERAAFVTELANVLANGQRNTLTRKEPVELNTPANNAINNFRITTYSSKPQPVKVYEEKSPKRFETNIARRSSFAESSRQAAPPVKRSVSQVSRLARARLSASNTNLVESSTDDLPSSNELLSQSKLRKTNSEISINFDVTDRRNGILGCEETGLQSLQVLRSILPQLSQSQGALNKVGVSTIEKSVEEDKGLYQRPKVNLSLSTWGERPKQVVSIKSDRDYVFGGKPQPVRAIPIPVKPTAPPQVTKVSSPVKTPESPKSSSQLQQSHSFKGPKTFAYKTLETGNMKPLKQILEKDSTRLPIVRSVELKKPYKMEKENVIQPTVQPVRPVSCYLFGYEPPKPEVKANEKRYTSIVDLSEPLNHNLKPVSERKLKPLVSLDPREELLQSIRSFGGKGNLKKVSVI